MTTRRTIRAIVPGAVRPGRMPPSFSAGSFCLSAPEGRLGACAWALRGSTEHQEPQSAPQSGRKDEKDHFHDHASEVRQGPRRHLRHHLARRRAMPRRHHDPRGEARSRRAARRHGRRHHRGRLPDRLGRRLRRRARDRQARQERGDLRPLARRAQGHRPLRRGDQAGQAQAHPHLPLHLAGAHEVQAAEGAARGATRW